MRRMIILGIAAAGAAHVSSGVARAEFSLSLFPSRDNTLFEDPNGTVSNGAGPHLYAGLTGLGQIRRGAIAFDLSDIPASATITSVTLTLYHSRSGPVSPAPISLHRFLADWGEGASNAGTPGGSGATALDGDLTWTHRFYDDALWNTPGGDFLPAASATQNITTPLGRGYEWASPQLVADVQGWLADPATNFGWALLGNETAFGSAERFESKESFTPGQRPTLTILYDAIPAGSTWNIDGGGAWGAPANWTGGIPDAQVAEARFLDKLTPANAPAAITLGGQRTVGRLLFDNPGSYIIDSAAGEHLTIDNGDSTGAVEVNTGAHTVRAPLRIAAHTDATIASMLHAPGGITIDPGATLAKRGAGTFDVGDAAGDTGLQLAPGARLEVADGILATTYIRGGALEIDDGRVDIKADGTSAGASILDALELDGQGTLDLADNTLILRATAPTRDTVLAETIARIKTARNAAAGAWQGPGITSSAAESNPLTGLAALINPGLDQLSGQPVDPDDILIIYTWNGDANLDGQVNFDDYFRIDSAFLEQPPSPTYAHGDFNYDGTINFDDYFLIDSAFLGQGAPLAHALGAVTVPEPAALTGILAGIGLLHRRRNPNVRKETPPR